MGEEAEPHLTTTSFQVIIESDKVSPQPPLLQTEKSQLLQLLTITPVLQTPHSFVALTARECVWRKKFLICRFSFSPSSIQFHVGEMTLIILFILFCEGGLRKQNIIYIVLYDLTALCLFQ